MSECTTLTSNTERKAQPERYRALAELGEVAVLVSDPAGDIISLNQGAVELLGYQAGEVQGLPLRALLHPDDVDRVMRLHEACVEGRPVPVPFECRGVTKDGGILELVVVHAVHSLPRSVAAARWYLQEVTPRHQLREGELGRAAKTDAVKLLSGCVAHELNNLLQGIVSLLEVTVDGHVVGDAKSQWRRELQGYVDRGTQLARQLLLFAGTAAVSARRLDFARFVEEKLASLRLRVPPEVTLEVRASESELPVDADPAELEQVMVNLVTNALEVMPSGGRLEICAGERDGYVVLEVRDSGGGILDQVADQVWEPLFTTKSGQHLGLGLPVVEAVVSRLGGKVETESAAGRGTTVRVMLPRAAAVAVDGSGGVVAAPPAGRVRVLVVEDEAGTRLGITAVLKRLGHEVVAVGSGKEAEALPAEPRFNVLLSDVVLPDVSGAVLARELPRRWPGLKVILMSGFAADELVKRQVAEQRVRFLPKPFGAEALAAEVAAALAGGPQAVGGPRDG